MPGRSFTFALPAPIPVYDRSYHPSSVLDGFHSWPLSGRYALEPIDRAMRARLDILDVKADIERFDRMGQVTNGNDVDTGFGDWHDGLFIDTT